jgi:hypothetical protein
MEAARITWRAVEAVDEPTKDVLFLHDPADAMDGGHRK